MPGKRKTKKALEAPQAGVRISETACFGSCLRYKAIKTSPFTGWSFALCAQAGLPSHVTPSLSPSPRGRDWRQKPPCGPAGPVASLRCAFSPCFAHAKCFGALPCAFRPVFTYGMEGCHDVYVSSYWNSGLRLLTLKK